MGGVQRLTLINEAGLYKLITQSKTPKAQEFTNYVCSEILVSVRKTGSYSTNDEPPKTPPVQKRKQPKLPIKDRIDYLLKAARIARDPALKDSLVRQVAALVS